MEDSEVKFREKCRNFIQELRNLNPTSCSIQSYYHVGFEPPKKCDPRKTLSDIEFGFLLEQSSLFFDRVEAVHEGFDVKTKYRNLNRFYSRGNFDRGILEKTKVNGDTIREISYVELHRDGKVKKCVSIDRTNLCFDDENIAFETFYETYAMKHS